MLAIACQEGNASDGTRNMLSFAHMADKERKKDPVAVALAARRMKKMTPQQRTDVARKAAKARWGMKAVKHA